jgi:HEPN domain-containing protein
MTNKTLAQSYRVKAEKRLKILEVLFKEEAFSDVIREAQEIVELALKGMLRQVGVEPPKWHDVGAVIIEFAERLPEKVAGDVKELARISSWLRKEREFAFYGDIDFIPTEEYDKNDARRAIQDATYVCAAAAKVIPL